MLDQALLAQLVDKSNKSKEFTDLFLSIWPDKEKTSTVPLIIGACKDACMHARMHSVY